jgi:RNA-binding protein
MPRATNALAIWRRWRQNAGDSDSEEKCFAASIELYKNKWKMMKKMEGFQRKYLRGAAHSLKPLIFIGQKGLTTEVLKSTREALDAHELVKVKFNDFKEKDQKAEIISSIEQRTDSEMVGAVGHTAIFYRQQPDPEKRKIVFPR